MKNFWIPHGLIPYASLGMINLLPAVDFDNLFYMRINSSGHNFLNRVINPIIRES